MERIVGLKASETKQLGEAIDGVVSRFVLDFAFSGGATITVTVKGRVAGSARATENLPYKSRPALTDVAAGTAIAASGSIEVEATGSELELVVSAGNGTIDVVVHRVQG